MKAGRRLLALAGLSLSGMLAAGCGVQGSSGTGTSADSWSGPAVMQALQHLPNYSLTESVLEAYDLGAVAYSQDGVYSGRNYREDITGKAKSLAFMGATSLIFAGGHYYIDVTAPPAPGFQAGWYDIGPQPTGPYADVLQNFDQIGRAWRVRLAGSTATAAGSCSAAGRKGIAWRVKFLLPTGMTAQSAYGTACTDKKTGAPLAINFSYVGSDASGQPATFSDHFRVTAVGSMGPVTAPAGAAPAPKVSYAP